MYVFIEYVYPGRYIYTPTHSTVISRSKCEKEAAKVQKKKKKI